MTKAKRNYSLILKRDVNVLWDSIGSDDQAVFDFCATVSGQRIAQDPVWRP
ncbi:hypothetical protein [Bradyrhizobium retamae]|uniref:hypothetical protein n=1 Tax=Bradyrhizobium retamae TaxID=1300035 RepID=UPI0018D239A7|nr:hypothetical protein [Bradyrhizobium retamae]